MYETFEHTADLGLRVRATSLNQLMADAARGLFSMIVADLGTVERRVRVPFSISGPPGELLLFDWLSELLYTFETRRLLLADFQVEVSDSGLTATAWGEPIDPLRHPLDHEVKAITYHGLRMQREGEGWLAELIVDI